MDADIQFDMGRCPALLPGRLLYTPDHLWCSQEANAAVLVFGLTSYALRLLKEVYFLDWFVEPGTRVLAQQELGHVEASKSESDIVAPLEGVLVRFNPDILDDPSLIDLDPYGAGWLFEMEADPRSLLRVKDYEQVVTENWARVKRLLEGKLKDL